MDKREIQVHSNVSKLSVERLLRAWAGRNDAEVKSMGRLVRFYKTEGENMHWHISGRRKGMGTVEVIWLLSRGSITVLVHDNRRGFWAGLVYKDLAVELKEKLVDRTNSQ